MFKTRLISGIVLVAAALVLIITGGNVLFLATLLISYIGMFELYRIFHIEKELPGIVSYLAATVYYLSLKIDFLPEAFVAFQQFIIYGIHRYSSIPEHSWLLLMFFIQISVYQNLPVPARVGMEVVKKKNGSCEKSGSPSIPVPYAHSYSTRRAFALSQR